MSYFTIINDIKTYEKRGGLLGLVPQKLKTEVISNR